MKKTALSTQKAPAAIGPYSQGIQVGSFIYTSGQLGLHPETGEMPADIVSQTKLCMENIKGVLAAGGATLENVVKVLIFLKDMNDFAAMNETYGSFFPEVKPARSCVEVARIPKDGLVEIEVIACV